MNKKYKILNTIDSPNDLKKLDNKQLGKLSLEIADYIHNTITKLGGHYSSPLGVIDLTLALHYVYNTPFDKIIWDVGHQAYSHKIITGRREAFLNIRQLNNISGFLKRDESEYDAFGAGHSSTSISAALGFAHARDANRTDEKIVAVIGDGAMTNGLSFEALNNLGFHKTQLTIVLNDNSFSISESVGALSNYLTRLIVNPTYNQIRDGIWNISGKIPSISKQIRKLLQKTEEGIKATLTPGGLFEEFGVRYVGPIDGHDIKNLIKTLKSISKINSPILLHVYTNKSKYLKQETDDAIKYYSLSPKSKKKSDKISFSMVFEKAIMKLAENNNFHCITAAMKIGTGLNEFSDKYTNRYIDVGIAEGHAITYAAGLSAGGILPIIAIYSTFMQRAYDNIIHDLALQKLPAVICMDRSGLVGNDGPTHHGVFDMSFMRTIPGAIVTAPKNGFELLDLLYTGIKSNKLFSIRYGKILTDYDVNYNPKLLEIGSWETISKGQDIVVLAVGSMVNSAKNVVEKINADDGLTIGLVNCRFIKPIDYDMLDKLFYKYNVVYTIEEGILSGGFGVSVLEYSSKISSKITIKNIGINDIFVEHGSRNELLDLSNLSEMKLYEKIKEDL